MAAESGGATPLTPTIAKPWLLTRHAREWGLACFCFRREAFLCRARAGPLSREASPAIVESVQGCTAELVSPTLSNSKLDPPSCAGPALLFLLVQRACTDGQRFYVAVFCPILLCSSSCHRWSEILANTVSPYENSVKLNFRQPSPGDEVSSSSREIHYPLHVP